MNFYNPTRIVIGEGCIKENSDAIAAYGKRCIIVTGRNSAVKCGALKDVTDALCGKCEYVVYDKIGQNPSIESCIEGGRLAREYGAEFVIGIGGGSPLDAAKAVAVFAVNDIGEKELYSLSWQNALPVIAVGTTAGTGSEVTQVAVITDSQGKKKSFRANVSFPVLALSDVRYTEFMPDRVTRQTAVDALSHCAESYFCKSANEISRMYALKGAKLILDVFGEFDGEWTRDMRKRLYLGSVMGGVAISVTGTAFPHALGYFLTELHGRPHGEACAVYLPEFIRYNEKYAPKLYGEFEKFTGFDSDSFESTVRRVLPIEKIEIESDEYAVLRERWQTNSCLKKLTREHTPQELEQIIKRCVASL